MSDPLDAPQTERNGIIYATLAYLAWAVMPLYWRLLAQIPSIELTTHRVLWCGICVLCISMVRGRISNLISIVTTPQLIRTLMLTSVLITCNWTIFIYCVESQQLVAASLGYYITPLISIVLGITLLGEQVSAVRLGAIGLASAAVGWQAIQLGYIPWVAPVLAVSFGFYGYFRKLTPVDSLDGLTVETCLLFPVTLLLVAFWAVSGSGAFPKAGAHTDALLVFAGPLTAIPLVLFAAGARRVRLVTLGFLQFLSPSITLAIAVEFLGEHFSRLDAVTFGCVWGALLIVALEGRVRRVAAGRAL